MALNLTEKDLGDKDKLGTKLVTLAEIIVRKHFYASYSEKDDLVSVGVLKALTLIDKGAWSKDKGSFLNYVYTGMRNDMHNYLYHQNKESFIDDKDNEEYQNMCRCDNYLESEACDLDYALVACVCMDFTKVFGNGIEFKVVAGLEDMGFHVVNFTDEYTMSKCCDNLLQEAYGKEAEEDIISRLIGLVLWKRKEYA